MNSRRQLLFKLGGEVVVTDSSELNDSEIERMKWIICEEMECEFKDIHIEVIEITQELSDEVDCSDTGLIFWKSLFPDPIRGVYCELKEGSDAYLDAISNGTIQNYLNFFI